MTGWEQLAVWLFGILTAGITVCSVAKAKAAARQEASKVWAQAWVEAAQVAQAPLFPRKDWTGAGQ